MSWTGCASSKDPNRFVLHVNVTCPDWTKRNVTVTLRADVLKSSTGALSVIDVDDEAVGARPIRFASHFWGGLQSSCSCSWSAQLHGRGACSLRRGCLHVTLHGGALPVLPCKGDPSGLRLAPRCPLPRPWPAGHPWLQVFVDGQYVGTDVENILDVRQLRCCCRGLDCRVWEGRWRACTCSTAVLQPAGVTSLPTAAALALPRWPPQSEVNAAIAAADKPKLENLASVAAKVDKASLS